MNEVRMSVRTSAAVLAVAVIVIAAAGFTNRTKVTVSKPPAHVTAGTTWNALVNVSRRGRRLDGFRTAIEIQDADGRVTFLGHEIEPGVYRVRVVFPRVGHWTYKVKIGSISEMRGGLRVVPR